MTTGGLHLLSGLAIAGLIRNEKYNKLKWGIVWGSIFPDIDLIASFFGFIFFQDTSLSTEVLHRSVTHGFLAMGMAILIGLIISRSRENYKWVFPFSLAFAFGMLTHTFYDLLDGYVAILAPFSFTRYSITGANLQVMFGDTLFKAWNAFDLLSDSIFFLVIWYWATHKTKLDSEQRFAGKLRMISIFSICYFGIFFVLAFTNISMEIHYALMFIVYIIFTVPLSTVIIHLKMRETIQSFSFFEIRSG